MAAACLSLTLIGCDESGRIDIALAPIPGDIRACINAGMTGVPKRGTMSKQEVVALMAALRRSEVAHTRCGQRLLSWYDAQAAIYAQRGRRW